MHPAVHGSARVSSRRFVRIIALVVPCRLTPAIRIVVYLCAEFKRRALSHRAGSPCDRGGR
jgi:hypothetical protein